MAAALWVKSRFLLASTAIALGIGALVAWQLLDSRAGLWQRASEANTNLLFTVSEVVERALDSADRAISHSVSVMEVLAAEQEDISALSSDAGRVFSSLGALDLFAAVPTQGYGIQLVLDSGGRVVAASRPPPKADLQFSDRSYFTIHRDHPDVGFYISPPFVSSYDGQLSVAMSRRWNRPDGQFGGVVVQTMKLAELHALFSSFELGPGSGVNVLLRDGVTVTRFPYTAEYIGSSLAGTDKLRRMLLEKQGQFTGEDPSDGIERFYVFRSLDRFPLIVSVGQSTASILAPWRRTAWWLGGATLLLMSACVWLAVVAERRLRAYRRMASRLQQAEHDLRTLINSVPVLVAYWDDQLVNRMANIFHERWFGHSPEKMRGRHISEIIGYQTYRRVRPYMLAALAGKTQRFELEAQDLSGQVRHLLVTYEPDREHGKVNGFFVLVTDISERKAAEAALFEEKERFRIILDSIKDGVITTGPDRRIVYLNPAAASMTGWSVEEAAGLSLSRVVRLQTVDGREVPDDGVMEALRTREARRERVENILLGLDGRRIHIESSAAPIVDGNGELRGAVIVFHEIGQVRAMANRMSHLAQHDALTGLPNRRRLDDVGREAVERAAAEGRHLAILYLDLDGFKSVNDSYGHAAGDELLVAVTRRMTGRLRASDTLYRQGGDEFVVLMTGVKSAEEAERLSVRLIECCREPVSVADRRLSVTVSIGIALYPDHGQDLDTLIQRADMAMYVAKNAGRNCYAMVDGEVVTPGEDLRSHTVP